MKQTSRQLWNNCFLDVTEFILTGPNLPRLSQVQQSPISINNQIPTPANLPVVIEVDAVQLSPYFKEIFRNHNQTTIQFLDFNLDFHHNKKNKKGCTYTAQLIQEEDDSLEDSNDQQSQNQQISSQDQSQQQNESQEQIQQIPQQQQLQTTKLNITYFRKTLKQLQNNQTNTTTIREFILGYLVEEDLENKIIQGQNIQELVRLVQWNLRQVGVLSWLERRNKVQKYLQKKKRRIWRKTINYDCRKRVADGRLRVKGKFVTKEQACLMLGIQDCQQQELKRLLELKYGRTQEI